VSNDEQPAPERAVSLGYLLKHAHLQLSELGHKALAPFGVDGKELGILVVIAGPEPLSQQQVAQRLGVDRTTMVAMLDALERKTLVARHPHPDDRRRNVVELTEPGREVFRRAIKARDEVERAYLAPLSASSSEHLRNSLKAIVTAPENNRQ
jgi:DNA-binding MarR family transcriptional regulator